MPIITANGVSFNVPEGKRLVLALEENGVGSLHRCGGHAKCTTCRVEFKDGEPERMTRAERERLEKNDLLGDVRLSCQIPCVQDMTVEVVYPFAKSDLDDPGPTPKADITPDPEWVDVPEGAMS